ncbi:MAG TPA: hypothetical protein VK738_15050 [Terriglobales bacterium]|jgi:hypothetical protein|nr:hypothetical protein [Terriglobales bacterium]
MNPENIGDYDLRNDRVITGMQRERVAIDGNTVNISDSRWRLLGRLLRR